MKFYELLFSLHTDQWIAFYSDKPKGMKLHSPMKVGNITMDMIGCRHNLWKLDVYNIHTYHKNGKDILYFNLSDLASTSNKLDMYDVANVLAKRNK